MESPLTDFERAKFAQDGFLVLNNFAPLHMLHALQDLAIRWLAKPQLPFELERDTGYPGAPKITDANGANTTRRLLQAFDRSDLIKEWCLDKSLTNVLRALLRGNELFLTRAHHNCLMTKDPRFSSDTGWHQDIRYWSFNNGDLVSSWLALGDENLENGALNVIPGSHRIQYSNKMFDEQLFFKADLQENKPLLDKAIAVELKPGDLLLFHAKLLHRASRNTTDKTKLSLVFTYHNEKTWPIEESRSSRLEAINIKT